MTDKDMHRHTAHIFLCHLYRSSRSQPLRSRGWETILPRGARRLSKLDIQRAKHHIRNVYGRCGSKLSRFSSTNSETAKSAKLHALYFKDVALPKGRDSARPTQKLHMPETQKLHMPEALSARNNSSPPFMSDCDCVKLHTPMPNVFHTSWSVLVKRSAPEQSSLSSARTWRCQLTSQGTLTVPSDFVYCLKKAGRNAASTPPGSLARTQKQTGLGSKLELME
jgi:hypothetical protein